MPLLQLETCVDGTRGVVLQYDTCDVVLLKVIYIFYFILFYLYLTSKVPLSYNYSSPRELWPVA